MNKHDKLIESIVKHKDFNIFSFIIVCFLWYIHLYSIVSDTHKKGKAK